MLRKIAKCDHGRDGNDQAHQRGDQGLADPAGQFVGPRRPARGGDLVEGFDHAQYRAGQAEHRSNRADHTQHLGLAVQPPGLVLSRFFHRRLVFGEPELAGLIALQAGQDDVGNQGIVVGVVARLDRLVDLALVNQGLQFVRHRVGHQRAFADRHRVLDDESQGDDWTTRQSAGR